jgi:hypothetical protein
VNRGLCQGLGQLATCRFLLESWVWRPENIDVCPRDLFPSFDHDRHVSSDFQSERCDRFKLPLVGMAALSPGRIST